MIFGIEKFKFLVDLYCYNEKLLSVLFFLFSALGGAPARRVIPCRTATGETCIPEGDGVGLMIFSLADEEGSIPRDPHQGILGRSPGQVIVETPETHTHTQRARSHSPTPPPPSLAHREKTPRHTPPLTCHIGINALPQNSKPH